MRVRSLLLGTLLTLTACGSSTRDAVVVTTLAPSASTPIAGASSIVAATTSTDTAATVDESTSAESTDTPQSATTSTVACPSVDLGGGLVVRPCVADLSPGSAETGATAAPNSILTLPEASFAELEPVDVTVRQARDISGSLVTFYVFGSDTLFDTGSSQLRSTAQPALAGAVASIRQRFASATIVVRGHTDSTGAAAANVKLSTARAQAVAARLGELGLAGSHLTTVGLGSSVPAALETNPDGSVNDLGRQLNRRVEVVVVQPVP